MALANVVATNGSPLYAQAEKAYETVMQLLSKIACLSRGDRKSVEAKLKEPRVLLDQIAARLDGGPQPELPIFDERDGLLPRAKGPVSRLRSLGARQRARVRTRG